ncbi:MAG: PaaI family thioesterase [Candidatus Baltobacteraceae bacterium]
MTRRMRGIPALVDPVDDGHCFACGPASTIGLHLRFVADGEGVRAETRLASTFQGWVGVAHGGIVMTLLDEAMAHAAGMGGVRGVTAELRARFRRPIPLDRPLVIRGRILWRRQSVYGLEAEVRDGAGVLLASGAGHFVAKGSVVPGQLGVLGPDAEAAGPG